MLGCEAKNVIEIKATTPQFDIIHVYLAASPNWLCGQPWATDGHRALVVLSICGFLHGWWREGIKEKQIEVQKHEAKQPYSIRFTSIKKQHAALAHAGVSVHAAINDHFLPDKGCGVALQVEWTRSKKEQSIRNIEVKRVGAPSEDLALNCENLWDTILSIFYL